METQNVKQDKPQTIEVEGTVIEEKEKKKRNYMTFDRICDNPRCGKEFTAHKSNARFCCDSCRSAARAKKPGLGSTAPPQAPKQKSLLPVPKVQGLPPHLQMAFDLLKENSNRWETWYKEERAKREDLEERCAQLRDQLRDNEQKQMLDGIEDSRPQWYERVLGAIPAPVMEQIAPHIGTLVGKLAGSIDTPNNMGGQLDEVQMELVAWLNQLPDPVKNNMLGILGTLTQLPEDARNETISRIIKLLTEGSAMKAGPSPNHVMFGN